MTDADPKFCCNMRQKFLVGIVASDSTLPVPVDAVDFIDFEAKREDGKPVCKIKYCPFCGKLIDGPLRVQP